MLQTLKLFKLTHWPEPPPPIPASLRHLELMACPGLFSLDSFQHLNHVQVLKLGLCPDLIYVSVRHFARLEELSLVDIAARKLDDLNCPPLLREVHLAGLGELRRIGTTGTPQRALRKLTIAGCQKLYDISGLASFVGMKYLAIGHVPRLTDLKPLAGLEMLTHVAISHCPFLTSVAPLAELPGLRKVAIHRCPAVRDAELLKSRIDGNVTVTG